MNIYYHSKSLNKLLWNPKRRKDLSQHENMNGNAKFPTQDKNYFRKGRLIGLENVQRRPFYCNVLFLYVCFTTQKKKWLKQIWEVLKFNRTGWCIEEYLYFYYTMLEIFAIKVK